MQKVCLCLRMGHLGLVYVTKAHKAELYIIPRTSGKTQGRAVSFYSGAIWSYFCSSKTQLDFLLGGGFQFCTPSIYPGVRPEHWLCASLSCFTLFSNYTWQDLSPLKLETFSKHVSCFPTWRLWPTKCDCVLLAVTDLVQWQFFSGENSETDNPIPEPDEARKGVAWCERIREQRKSWGCSPCSLASSGTGKEELLLDCAIFGALCKRPWAVLA